MSIFRRGATDEQPGDDDNIREFTTAAERGWRPANDGQRPADLGTLLQRVSLNSVQEIDRLIDELQTLKARLQREAQQIHREIVEFASLSQAAVQSTRVIAESLAQWRRVPDAPTVSE